MLPSECRSFLLTIVIACFFLPYSHQNCLPFSVRFAQNNASKHNQHDDKIYDDTRYLHLVGSVPYDLIRLKYIRIFLNTLLKQEKHFHVILLKPENLLPQFYRNFLHLKANETLVTLSLNSIIGWSNGFNNTAIDLNVVGAFMCQNRQDFESYRKAGKLYYYVRVRKSSNFVTKILPKSNRYCPKVPFLPDVSYEFNSYLQNRLSLCVDVIVLNISQLLSFNINSFKLLLPNQPILIIQLLQDNEEDNSFFESSKIIDKFLSRHSVLLPIWEPYDKSDPKWVVLMSLPRGMPGHLAAMIDTIQYQHPSITSYISSDNSMVRQNGKRFHTNCQGMYISTYLVLLPTIYLHIIFVFLYFDCL